MTPAIQGFLLGLANGASCLTSCAPVLLPYLVAEGRSFRNSGLLYFLGGRLAGYLGFAVFAWEAGKWIRSGPRGGLFFGAIYAVLACILVLYGFSPQPVTCAAAGIKRKLVPLSFTRPATVPAVMGLLTGLSMCPPFVAALAGATSQGSLLSSLCFFLFFFVATSLYLMPFSFAGSLGRHQGVRITGRLAAGVMGCYYFYRSLILIHGGLQS
jgi:hypothetical protein